MSSQPNVNWGSSGNVAMGSVTPPCGPYDATAIAPTCTTAGFTGTPVISNTETRIYGNIISGTFLVTGLTAASGSNAVTFTLPHAVVGGTFTRGLQGGAQLSGLSAATGQAISGIGTVNVGAATITATIANNSGTSVVLNGGLQVSYVYCLI